ncbi:ABC transporter permease [Nitriliruptoraceae bacterium ZYF776]|nr:ABC transporter permease [Profundirhabdus halotolerans]
MRRLLGAELLDELRGVRRDPTAWFFSVAMPVGFYALFSSMFGSEIGEGGARVGTMMVANFGAFGVLMVATMNPGISLAEERQKGWLRVKRTWAVPLPVTLAGKSLFAAPMVVVVLSLMSVIAVVNGDLDVSPLRWVLWVASMLLAALPFVFLGLAVGAWLSPNAGVAVLNAFVLPGAIVGGLWFPLEQLPELVQRIAPFVPTYHLRELAHGVMIGGTDVADHLLALGATTVVTAAVAAFAYRRIRP